MEDNSLKNRKLSIGIPIYNEEENLSEIVNRISQAMDSAQIRNYELVFADNCSIDHSIQKLQELRKSSKTQIKIVKHARNYGYQTSLQTCLKYSDGDYVAIMDGDLQDPPELLPIMLNELLKQQKNIIYGKRISRAGGIINRIFYKLYYKIWQKLADVEIQVDSGEFAIYDRFSVDQILKFKEKNRFQRGIRAYLGLNQIEYPYHREVRHKGKTKFNFGQQLQLGLDGIYSFSFAPIRMMMIIGLNVTFFSFVLSIISVTLKIINFYNQDFNVGQMGKGLVQIFLVFTMLLGIIIIMLGIIGEYLGRIYDEIRDRPIIIESINGEPINE
jgi:glycosyltransferase involved in cell wall biosynthesis